MFVEDRMKNRLRNNAELLTFLCSCQPKTSKVILKSAPPELINCISEICLNILKGNVDINANRKKVLGRYKSIIRQLAKRSTRQSTKKKLIQKGGFLSAILPLIGSIIPTIAQALFGKR